MIDFLSPENWRKSKSSKPRVELGKIEQKESWSTIKSHIEEWITKQKKVAAFAAYGSWVNGAPQDNSDVDLIALVYKAARSNRGTWAIDAALREYLGRSVSVFDSYDLSNSSQIIDLFTNSDSILYPRYEIITPYDWVTSEINKITGGRSF